MKDFSRPVLTCKAESRPDFLDHQICSDGLEDRSLENNYQASFLSSSLKVITFESHAASGKSVFDPTDPKLESVRYFLLVE